MRKLTQCCLWILLFVLPFNLVSATTQVFRSEFSPGDKLIDKIADEYGQNFTKTLAQLKHIEDQIYGLGYDEIAYYQSYRCYLQVFTQLNDDLVETLEELTRLKHRNPTNRSILASYEFCLAWKIYQEKDYKTYEIQVEKAYQQVTESHSPVLRYWISITFADIANKIGRYNDSIEASQIALEVALTNNDDYREVTTRSFLALAEAELGFFDEALKNNLIAIEWYEKKQLNRTLLMLYQNRGYMLIRQGSLDAASEVFEKAIKLARKIDAKNSIYSMYTNLAAIEQKKENYQKSNEYAEQALNYGEENNNPDISAHANAIIALNLVYLDDFKRAELVFNKANEHFIQYDLITYLADSYAGWSKAFAEKRQYQIAYEAHVEYINLSNKIYDSEREGRMQRFKSLYESVEKDREIERLRESNRIKSIEITNAQLQREVFWLSGAVAVLLILLLFLMYRRMLAKNSSLQNRNIQLDLQRYQDQLTNVYNRRYFDVQIITQIKNKTCRRYSFFLLDIDHFKQVNDRYGHHVGDQVLIEFTLRLQSSMRDSDKLIRMGGEEFLIVLENTNEISDEQVAKKLLSAIAETTFTTDAGELSITMSIGIVYFDTDRSNVQIDMIVELADKALYFAKECGRNRAAIVKQDALNNEKVKFLLSQPVDKWVSVISIN
ncbi:GGDEF domain-containing protein [Aliikangiella maris]